MVLFLGTIFNIERMLCGCVIHVLEIDCTELILQISILFLRLWTLTS